MAYLNLNKDKDKKEEEKKNGKFQKNEGPRYTAITENKVTIYKNCIVHKGKYTLYFLMNMYNYNLYSVGSNSSQLDVISNLILNLENVLGEVKFSLFRFHDIVSPQHYLEDFIKTVRLWQPDFQPTPEFKNNLHVLAKDYCFLAINIDEKKNIDLNQASLKDIAKGYIDSVLDAFSSYEQQQVDTKRIDTLTTQIFNVGQNLLRPCPEEILMSFYINRIFPSYDIVLDRSDAARNKAVLSYLQQDFIDHFNYFEMTNAGVELFGAKQQITYGSIIDIVEFPDEITSEYFPLTLNGLIVNSKTMTKQQAKLKFTRKRADIEFEEETAMQAGSRDVHLELADYKDLTDLALAGVSKGMKFIDSDMHILVLGDDLDTLNERRAGLISDLKDRDIIATFSPVQAPTYIDSFIKMRPKKYPFTTDLRFPLAFRLNQGNTVGDQDSKYTVPVIGHYVDSAEATSNQQY